MSETSRRVVVHAGLGKTGTSAVQRWLQAHRDELAERGIFYPDHHIDANGVSSGNWTSMLELVEGQIAVSESAVTGTLATFESSGCEILLLSSEFFGGLLSQLAEALPPESRYILYVRDPVEYLESAYIQMVKRARATEPINPLRDPVDYAGPEFDITPVGLVPGAGIGHLEAILSSLPDTVDVVLRPYHPQLFLGGGIVPDLFAAADLPTDFDFPTNERVNDSYTLPALEFKRVANHLPLGELQHRLDVALQSCAVGSRGFTLIEPESQPELRSFAVAEIDRLIDRCGRPELGPLRDLVARAPAKPFLAQHADRDELRAVAAHVGAVDERLLGELRQLSAAERGVTLPYPGFPDFN